MSVKTDFQPIPFSLGWEKVYLSLIRGLIYLAVVAPLLVSSAFFFPYVVPKTVFFRIVVDLLLIAYILLILTSRRYLPKINKLGIILAVFIGVSFLAGFLGVNFERSFWSNFERMTGLLTMLHLFAFFLVLTAVFKKREDWEKLFTFSMAVAVLISFYFLFGRQEVKLAATLGNTTFMAGLLLFNVFFALMLFFNKKGGWRIFYGFSFLVIAIALMLSTSQAAIASFWLGLFLFALVWFFWQKKYSLKKSLLILSLLLVAAVILLTSTGFLQKALKDVSRKPTFRSRLLLWNIAWQGWQERPWLGWGPENFNVVFAKHFDPRLFLNEYGGEHWFDRSHNIIFDTLTETGILGLLSYLAIFAFALFVLLKNLSGAKEPQKAVFSLGMIVVLLTYFAQNLFVFDMISTYIIFFLGLGFINFLLSENKEPEVRKMESKKMGPTLFSTGAVFFIAIVIFVLYWGDVRPALASYYTLRGIAVPLDGAPVFFEKALSVSPIAKTETPEQFARKVLSTQLRTKKDKEILEGIFPQVLDPVEQVVKERPLDFRIRLTLAELYYRLYTLNKEEHYLQSAENILKDAISLSPQNQQGFWHLSQVKLLQGEKEEAVALLQKAIELEPKLGVSHWYLAKTYSQLENFSQAKEELMRAEQLGYRWQGNAPDLKQGIKIYQGLKDYDKVISLCRLGLNSWPKDMGLWITLIKTYQASGQKDKAQETLNFLKTTFPNLDVERFLLDKNF